jgi:Fe-S cluster assembly scaffold protein SufB
MEQSPNKHRLEQVLRSDKLVAGGFMGTDSRSIDEVIDADTAEVSKAGVTVRQLAERMQQITDAARKGLGTWVRIDDNRRAMVAESKGTLVCPWPHSGRYYKTVTTVEHVESGQTTKWADLNIHMIAEHGFFEGRGAVFRIEPGCLIEIIL